PTRSSISAPTRSRASPSMARRWQSAKPVSTITMTTARATRRSGVSAATSRRRAPPAFRWSFIRATPMTTWRESWKRKWGRGPSTPALLFSPGAPAPPRRAIALGLYISFTGIVTFKKSDELRTIAASLPDDRFLVETDAPYLAPGRYRGKRNEPAYVPETAKVLAEARGVSPEEFARQTTDNFFRLFSN